MRLAVASLVLACAACVVRVAPAPPPGRVAIEHWNRIHPEAAAELCVWVRTHPQAAHLFFEWDAGHTARAHEFVTWTILHPALGIDAFAALHPGWPVFDAIATTHRPGANAFMAWCRRHPRAAEALMDHPAGLAWAGNHLGC